MVKTNHRQQAELFSDIFFADAKTGYAAGEVGIYRSLDSGVNWSIMYRGMNFINIAARGPNACFVNSTDTIYHTANAGATVQKRSYPSPNNFYPNGFTDVFFTASGTGFASSNNYIFRSINGGGQFDSLTKLISASFGDLSSLWFENETHGWIARSNGIFRTTNGGVSWQLFNTSFPTRAFSITWFSSLVGFVTAPNSIYKTTDGGNTWQLVFAGTLNSDFFIDLAIIDAQTVYFCYDRRIYKTTNGGAQWTVDAALAYGRLIELHFIDGNTGWACGENGSVLRFKR